MSTKIYDAYRYEGEWKHLFGDLTLVRDLYRADTKLKILQTFNRIYEEKGDFSSAIDEAVGLLTNGIKGVDLTASVSVYTYYGRIYIQTFGLSIGHLNPIARKLSDYHYQNQTDRPRNITESHWKDRKNVWMNKIFKDYSTPKMAGFIFEILDAEEIRMIIQLSRFK